MRTAFDLHDVLNRRDPKYGSEEDQARWRSQILRLEERFQRLKATDRFIKT